VEHPFLNKKLTSLSKNLKMKSVKSQPVNPVEFLPQMAQENLPHPSQPQSVEPQAHLQSVEHQRFALPELFLAPAHPVDNQSHRQAQPQLADLQPEHLQSAAHQKECPQLVEHQQEHQNLLQLTPPALVPRKKTKNSI
jgi:hypothetical protein